MVFYVARDLGLVSIAGPVCLLLHRDGGEGLEQQGRRPSLSSVAIRSNRACASEPNTNIQGGCS
jgi:hypothetical protein